MNQKISELPTVEKVTDDMVVLVVAGGETRKLRIKDLIYTMDERVKQPTKKTYTEGTRILDIE
jgi:hypothetical protein